MFGMELPFDVKLGNLINIARKSAMNVSMGNVSNKNKLDVLPFIQHYCTTG